MKLCTLANAVSAAKYYLGQSDPRIKASRTPGNLRSLVISKHFGDQVVEAVSKFRSELCYLAPIIEGLHVEFMELTNGGFYFSCLDDQLAKGQRARQVAATWRFGNSQPMTLSFDAASIVATLLTYAELGGTDEDDRFRLHFNLLIEYAKCHDESESIQRLTQLF